jgi:hypothetical protein
VSAVWAAAYAMAFEAFSPFESEAEGVKRLAILNGKYLYPPGRCARPINRHFTLPKCPRPPHRSALLFFNSMLLGHRLKLGGRVLWSFHFLFLSTRKIINPPPSFSTNKNSKFEYGGRGLCHAVMKRRRNSFGCVYSEGFTALVDRMLALNPNDRPMMKEVVR